MRDTTATGALLYTTIVGIATSVAMNSVDGYTYAQQQLENELQQLPPHTINIDDSYYPGKGKAIVQWQPDEVVLAEEEIELHRLQRLKQGTPKISFPEEAEIRERPDNNPTFMAVLMGFVGLFYSGIVGGAVLWANEMENRS